MTELGEGTLEFGNALGFAETQELFSVACGKWRVFERTSAEAGQKVMYGEGESAFVLYDPLPDFLGTPAEWMILVGPYGQSGYELAPPSNTALSARSDGRELGTVSFLREVAGPYDLGLYVYTGQGPTPV